MLSLAPLTDRNTDTHAKIQQLLLLLLQPFYSPLFIVRDYPGEPVAENYNQSGFTHTELFYGPLKFCPGLPG